MSGKGLIDSLIPKPTIGEKLYNGVEKGLDSIGLMQGESAPSRRIVFGFLVGTAITYAVKPASMFEGGQPRPWKLLDPKAKNGTALPWFAPGVGLGILLGVFI